MADRCPNPTAAGPLHLLELQTVLPFSSAVSCCPSFPHTGGALLLLVCLMSYSGHLLVRQCTLGQDERILCLAAGMGMPRPGPGMPGLPMPPGMLLPGQMMGTRPMQMMPQPMPLAPAQPPPPLGHGPAPALQSPDRQVSSCHLF